MKFYSLLFIYCSLFLFSLLVKAQNELTPSAHLLPSHLEKEEEESEDDYLIVNQNQLIDKYPVLYSVNQIEKFCKWFAKELGLNESETKQLNARLISKRKKQLAARQNSLYQNSPPDDDDEEDVFAFNPKKNPEQIIEPRGHKRLRPPIRKAADKKAFENFQPEKKKRCVVQQESEVSQPRSENLDSLYIKFRNYRSAKGCVVMNIQNFKRAMPLILKALFESRETQITSRQITEALRKNRALATLHKDKMSTATNITSPIMTFLTEYDYVTLTSSRGNIYKTKLKLISQYEALQEELSP